MKKLIGLAGLTGLAAVALAVGGWMVNGHGEISTPQGDAYLDIRGESRGNGNAAVGSARFVIVDEDEHQILGVDLPRGQGQFNFARHDAVLQGPGAVRNANGVRQGPVSVAVHDGGPTGTDHIRVSAGNHVWEGDLTEGNIIVAPRR